MPKQGYKTSLLHAAGIHIIPIGIGQGICSKFRISVTKTDKYGKVIKVEGKNPMQTYPLVAGKDELNIWQQIQRIEDFYYEKLTEKRNKNDKS